MKLKNLVFLLLLLGPWWVFPEKKELDLQAVIDLALTNNTGLKLKHQETAFQKLTRDTSWNVLLPVLTASSTLSRLHEAPSAFELAGGAPALVQGENWGVGFGFSATLNLSAALVHGILYTGKQYEAGLLDEDTFRKNLIRDVKKAFYNLLLLEENIKLFRGSLETAGKRFEQARLKFETGASSQFELLTAQVAFENLKPGLKELENGYRIALSNFKASLGLKDEEEIGLRGEIVITPAALSSERLLTRYFSRKLELQALTKAIEAAEILRQGLLIRSYTPALLLSLSFDPAFTGNPFTDDWFADPEKEWVQRQGMFAVTLSLSLDGFIPGSATSIRLAELKKEREKLVLQREEAVRGAEQEIRSLVRNMEKIRENLDSLSLNVQLAARAYQIASEGYQTGARVFVEVENAEDELHKAQWEVLREKYNYLAHLADLEAALNLTDELVKEIQNEN